MNRIENQHYSLDSGVIQMKKAFLIALVSAILFSVFNMAYCQDAADKYLEEFNNLSAAIQKNPSNLQAYLRYAEIFADNLSDINEAKAILDMMTFSNNASAEAFALKARFLAERNCLEDAKKALRKANDINSEDKETLVTKAMIAMQEMNYSDADAALTKFQKLFPKDKRGLNLRIQLELQRDRAEKAEELARENAEKEDSAISHYKLLDILIKSGKINDAKIKLEELRAKNYPGFMMEFFDGQISLYQKDWQNAVDHFKKARMEMKQIPELNAQTCVYLGICYEQLEQYDLQLKMFGEALKVIPQSVRARTGYALALFHLGCKSEAREELIKVKEQIGEKAFFSDLRLRVIFYQLESDNPQSEDESSEIVNKLDENKEFENVDLNDPDQVLARCETLIKDNKVSETYELFKKGLDVNPNSLPLLYGMSGLMLQTTRPDAAKPYLERILQLNEEKPDPNKTRLHWARRNYVRLLLSIDYSFENQAEGLKLLEANIVESDEPSVEDLKMKAIILVSLNNPRDRGKAIEIMEDIIKRGVKFEPEEQFLLGRLFNEAEKWDLAKEQMEELCEREPENVRYITEFVRMKLRRNQPVEEIEPYIKRLEKNDPKAIITVLLRSELLHIQDKDDQAADVLMNYLKSIPTAQKEEMAIIARQLNRIGQVKNAEKAFKRYMKKNPNGVFDYADFLARRQRLDKSLDVLLGLKGNPNFMSERILKAMLDALRVYPKEITPEQFKRVSDILDEYLKEEPSNLSILVQVAELRMLEGKIDEAEKVYEETLQEQRSTDWQKVVLYNNLSYALSVTGKNPQKSLDLIHKAIDIHGPAEYLLDTRALALLSFKDKDPAKLAQALSDLERAVAKNPSAIYYFHLIRAYLANGDRVSAKAALDICRNQYEMTINDVPKLERREYERVLKEL